MSQTLTKWHTERYGPPSEFGYEKLIPLFKAEKWDPDGLVKFFKENGARFIMPVACHHDNFDMYDSFHPWNSVKMGPKRDTLKEWKEAATKHGLKFGVSTHLYWSPRFLMAARKYQKPGTPEWQFFNMDYSPMGYATQDSWNEHWYARCWDVIEKYDPDMFNNDSPYPKIGGGKGLGIKLFTDYINRDLEENNGKQTVVLSFKDAKVDKAAFTYNLERGSAAEIKPEPWMWATDLSGNWFYRKGAVNKMSIPVMVGNAIDAISKNGVVMLNIALRGDGTLPENQAAYLTAIGDFLKINGEGIYGTRPWKTFGEGPLKMKDGRQGENHKDFTQEDIRFTTKGDTLYAFVLATPTSDVVIKTLAQGGVYDGDIGTISLLGSAETLTWERSAEASTIQLPKTLPDQPVIGFRISSASEQKRATRYPKFSWDKVPVAFHFGKSEALLTEAEAKFVASRSNFICLEKGHGSKQFGDTETGIEQEAQQLKKLNPNMKVIFYWNTFLDYDMYKAHVATFLVGVQENSYFIYNWGYRMELGCLEWYPEFDKPLGEPLGDMLRDGWTLSRKFKHASVWVNLETREADIQWHSSADQETTQQSKYLDTGGQRKLEILYKKASGQDLFLDLYYPTENRAEKCPVIVFTHGGGWAAGSRYKVANGAFAPVFQQLVKEGFAVAPVSYRLTKKDSNVAIRDCVIDCKDAIRFLAQNSESLGIDPMRVYVMGDSAGGQIAQMLLLSSPGSLPGDPALAGATYKMVAGVSWYGPCDFEKTDLFNHDDRPDFRDRFGPRIMRTDSKPGDKLRLYREISPINYLTQASPPLLMIQGDKDTTIPVKHAYYMQEKAEKLQAPVEIMIIKNAGHNWRKVDADIAPSRDVIIERTVQYFVDHL